MPKDINICRGGRIGHTSPMTDSLPVRYMAQAVDADYANSDL
jgi:hypothetical protein